ncbi:tape measure protein [Hymenobacter sp. NBH84]|uniref:tape measure protein n=1 Tax=Hymenobacter sp. NBH84 TaxID=2596915 RepID=UPI001623FC05|nr:tape measure protein [Hymenobacter sp. NBH84]QNE38995.1 tape measure protein [Hymenobacter sp. NBH84]
MDLQSLKLLISANIQGLQQGLKDAANNIQRFGAQGGRDLADFARRAGAAGRQAGNDFAAGFDAANTKIAKSFKDLEATQDKYAQGVGKLGGVFDSVGESLTRNVTLPLTLLGAAALKSAGDIQALETGFKAVYKSGGDVAEELEKVKEVAKLPGLGLAEAIQGSTRLQAVGLSAEEARKSLLAFGNAVATTGGGKVELGRINTQLSQLAAKGKVLTSDLRPIIEAAPIVSEALLKIYGTIDAETISAKLAETGKNSKDFINTLVAELGKLPKVTGGLNNSFENLSDSTTKSLSTIGTAINKSLGVENIINSLGDSLEGLADSFSKLPPSAQATILTVAGLAAGIGPLALAIGGVISILPTAIAGFSALGTAVTVATGPVGLAIAAIAALSAGIYYFVTASDRALESYQEQKKATTELTTSIQPLLDRYDELKAKTALNVEEQKELETIVKKVTAAVPGAKSEIDAYGNAIAINTKRTREFIAAQQQLTVSKARKSIGDETEELEKRRKRLELYQKVQDNFNKTGKIKLASLSPVATDDIDIVVKFQEQYAQVRKEFDEQNATVKDLKTTLGEYSSAGVGIGKIISPIIADLNAGFTQLATNTDKATGAQERQVQTLEVLKNQLKAARELLDTQELGSSDFNATKAEIARLEALIKKYTDTGKAAKKAGEDIAKAFQEVAAKLRGVDTQVKLGIVAPGAEAATEKIKILENGLKKLSDLGVSPTSAKLQALNNQLLKLSQSLDLGFEQLDLKVPDLAMKPVKVPIQLDYQGADKGKVLLDTTISMNKALGDATVASVAFGKSFDYTGAQMDILYTSIQKLLSAGFDAKSEEVQRLIQSFNQLANVQTPLDNFNQQLSAILVQGMSDIASGFGEAIGQIISGAAGIEALPAMLLGVLGDMAVNVGKLAISTGFATLGIKAALESLNPVAAIAGGIALVALGTAVKGAASNIGKSGGSYRPSTSGGSNYSGSSAASNKQDKLNIEVTFKPAELRADGRGLVSVLNVESYRMNNYR